MDLIEELAGGAIAQDAYDKLPESIKMNYSRREWMWLSDREKTNLVHMECEPDTFDD